MPDINFERYKPFLSYVVGFVSLVILVYLSIPFFFNYSNYGPELERKVLENFSLRTSVKGEIKYKFLPYPSLEVKKIEINDFKKSKKILGKIDKIILKIPFKKLVNVKKIDFNSLQIEKAKIRINLDQLKYYENYFSENFKSKPINFSKTEIDFYDKNEYIVSISDVSLNYLSDITADKTVLTGKFLGDDIVIQFQNKKDQVLSKNISLKLKNLGLLSIINLSDIKSNERINGNFKLKFEDINFGSDFVYKNNLIKIGDGKLKSYFFNGKISGVFGFDPFFDFNLNLDIKNLSFHKIYKKLSNLNKRTESNIFNLNRKINGILNLNIDNINSSSDFVDSMESEIEFMNGNIFFHKLLLNFKKIGASDINGILTNDGKNINLDFKQNIYIDNSKYFNRKFDLTKNSYINQQNISISGKINLKKMNIKIDEIDFGKKVEKEEINFIEENFNLILFDEGYKTFFDFEKIKEFINLVLAK